MWTVYFGEWTDGRLKRLPFFGYNILLMVISVAAVFGIVMLAGGMESLGGGFPALVEGMGMLVAIALFVFVVMMLAASFNIMAKRFRDMGLPGWWSVAAIIVISIILEMLFPAQHTQMSAAVVSTQEGLSAAMDADTSTDSIVVQLFNLLIWIVLLFIPSDFFKKSVV